MRGEAILGFLGFWIVSVFGVIMLVALLTADPIPRCYEDQVLVGIGQFDTGRYETYVCGPAMDDYEGYVR